MSSQWALSILTAALVVITAWYGWHTRTMAKEMRRQTQALIEPCLAVYPERREGRLWLVLANRGKSVARDVTLTVDRSVPTDDLGVKQPLTADRLFRESTSLGPDEHREVALGSEEWVMENYNDYGRPLSVTVSYTWASKPMTESVVIRLLGVWSSAELDNATRASHLRQTRA